MSGRKETDRVLGRARARELSEREMEMVVGGLLTHVCTFNFKTCTADMDCEQIPQCP
jgi:hypothetical protein